MKKINYFTMLSLTVLFIFIFVSCGGDSGSTGGDSGSTGGDSGSIGGDSGSGGGNTGGDGSIGDSENVSDEDSVPDDENQELPYPEVTETSNKSGDIAQNIVMYDELDKKHTLAEWYKPNNPSSKLIWLIFTAYDCAPCMALKENLLVINKKEYRDQGLKILLIFNGSYQSGPHPEEEPEKIASQKEIYLSEYPDTAQFEIYAYLKEQNLYNKFSGGGIFGGSGYPSSFFIDAATMEILDKMEGWGDDEGLVSRTENKIELLLGYL